MGKIFYLMGKSSVGKDTIYKKLLETEKTLHPMILYTTRPIREGETEGVEYYFVTEEQMKALQAEGKIIEKRSYDTIHGVWNYFTADDDKIDLKNNQYLGIGTLESYEKLRAYFGKEVLVPLYIELEDGERLRRALFREQQQKTPKYAELCRRYLADEADFSEENIAKAEIEERFLNVSSELCVEEIRNYMRRINGDSLYANHSSL